MVNPQYVGLKSDALLAKAFGGWSFNGFDFPSDGTDGCTGEKCISKAVHYYLRRRVPPPVNTWQASPTDTVGLLSGHLYFKASCGELKPSSKSFKLSLHEFHLTMRRSKAQLVIDQNGSSLMTSKESIHINRNTDWGRSQNIDTLVAALASDLPTAEVAFTRAELLDFLTVYRGYTRNHMKLLAEELMVDTVAHLALQIGIPVEVAPDVSMIGR